MNPQCQCCDRPTHPCELIKAPIEGPAERWCLNCVRQYHDEIAFRLMNWRDEEALFI